MVFLLAYNVFRVALFLMTQNGAVTPDHPLDPTMNAVIVYSELAIGVVGLAAVPGLLGSKPWGFWLTAGVSAYAIVFDAVAAFLVQPSAAGGVVPPAVILLLLLLLRVRLLPTKPPAAGPAATHG